MTEELYHLWYSIDEDVHELIAFSTEDLKAAQVAVISFVVVSTVVSVISNAET